ncbi:MAG: acyltransferase family protein [Promethearchaeota archaeon]
MNIKENPEFQSDIHSTPNTLKKEVPLDWKPQGIRLFSILVVVVGHTLFYTGYLINDAKYPLVWFGGVAIGCFMACSGYVHGLKDEFNKTGSLNISTYGKFFKKRLFRLYIGYYIALFVILVAKIVAGFSFYFTTSEPIDFGPNNPIQITPISLFLDLTCMWPLFTASTGGIWAESWFICAMMVLSLTYPLLRRLNSINKYYLYLVIIITLIFRFYIIFAINANLAYYFPLAWTAEFSLGIIIGDRVCKKGGPIPPTAPYQHRINAAAERVWPLYLFHMVPVVFMTPLIVVGDIVIPRAPFWEFLLVIPAILITAEVFHRILTLINNKLGDKNKKIYPIDTSY